MRLADAEAFGKILDKLKQKEEYYADQFDKKAAIRAECLKEVIKRLNNAPTIEVVPKELYEQILWERNIAMEQLEEHGIGFASKKE